MAAPMRLDVSMFCDDDEPLSLGRSGGLDIGADGARLTIYASSDPADPLKPGDVPAGLVALLERALEVARAGYQEAKDGD